MDKVLEIVSREIARVRHVYRSDQAWNNPGDCRAQDARAQERAIVGLAIGIAARLPQDSVEFLAACEPDMRSDDE